MHLEKFIHLFRRVFICLKIFLEVLKVSLPIHRIGTSETGQRTFFHRLASYGMLIPDPIENPYQGVGIQWVISKPKINCTSSQDSMGFKIPLDLVLRPESEVVLTVGQYLKQID